MRKIHQMSIFFIIGIFVSSCENFQDLDVPNYNNPNRAQVFSNTEDFPTLISGAYNAWWNHLMGASPQFALLPASETMGTGFGSWGANPFYAIPREAIPNTQGDPVLIPQASWWYGLYQAVPTVNDILNELVVGGQRVEIGNEDHTTSMMAHSYLLQGILFGHLAMLYDKTFLMDEETDIQNYEFDFTEYQALMDFAIERVDKAIAICDTATFTDPIEMMPGVIFNNALLARFANSMGARMLAYNARTGQQTQNTDWSKILLYAQGGINEDFLVGVEDGWRGLVIERDPWGYHQLVMDWRWVWVHQRLINMMAPDDPNAAFPWPFGVSSLGEVSSPDQRFDAYFEFNEKIRWASSASSKGYHIMTHYSFKRFRDLYNQGVGFVNFYTKEENEFYKAEAYLRMNQNLEEATAIINSTRVDKGDLEPARTSESVEELKEKLFYERLVENLMTFPLGSYFDRRRIDIEDMGLYQGTVRHLPIPAQELNLHGYALYTFGGIENEM